MSYNPVERMWSIKAVENLAQMEEVLNELQDEGYKIHEVSPQDLIIIYYKEKEERIDG